MSRFSSFPLRAAACTCFLLTMAAESPAIWPFRKTKKDISQEPAPGESAANIEFIGNRSFTPDELRKPLVESNREIVERGLSKARADDTAYYLAVFYRKNGFAKVEVNYDIRGNFLILRIDEGPRAYLRAVTFHGNKEIPELTLYDYMVGATKERLAESANTFPYVEGDVQSGVEHVRGLYESEGFLDVVIDPAKVDLSNDGTHADVSVTVHEGRRYMFGEVRFAGNTIFPREELMKGLGETLEKPFTPQRLNEMERNLQFFYKSHGYYNAKVDSAGDPKQASGGRVPVVFTAMPHQLFRFNGVTVQGLDRLKPSFLPKRFAPLKGEIYDPAKLDEKYRELLRTGLFKNLRVNSLPQEDDTIRLDLTVEEAKAKELGFTIGAGSYDGVSAGLRLGDRDFMGNGRPLTFNIDVSQRGSKGELLYVDPWLFDGKNSLRARLFAQSRTEVGYSKQEFGFRADILRKLTKNVEVGVFLQVKQVTITESFIVPEFLGPENYVIASLGLTQSFDFRDPTPVAPKRGWIITTALDLDALSSSIAFGRATVRGSYYMPLSEKVMVAFGARGGLILPFTEVPIDERYFNGGSTTVRSFRERRLGPFDRHGNPIGGQAFTAFNAELTFPLYGQLQGAVFADAGNLIATSSDAGVQEMRYGIGIGVRYALPIGPLRLDLALNPNPRDQEAIGAFHFTFGIAF